MPGTSGGRALASQIATRAAGIPNSEFRIPNSDAWAAGYAFGLSLHIVASTAAATTAHATMEYITINHAVCSE